MSPVLEKQLPEKSKGAPMPEQGQTVVERVLIDRSCRVPVLLFFSAAIFWLLLGSLFGFLASWKLHHPEFLADWSWLTWGRLRQVHLNMIAYGWSSPAGIGVGIWLMSRLSRVELRHASILIVAAVFWNIGVLLGVIGIMIGHSQSIEWLEFPAYATPLLFVSYAFVAVWAVIMFRFRRPGHVYVSQWYLIAAFFWFPWLYGTACVLTQAVELKGVTLGAVNWWFGHNVLGLWITPIGLAAAYYFIPKVIGRPVHSYYLSAIGFWSLALFYSWNGMHHLVGGPFPAWLISASIVASMMMVIPVLTTAINHHMTMKDHFSMLEVSPTLRFVVFGAMSYTLVSLQGISMAFQSVSRITHFTHYTVGHSHLGMYLFFSMILFGSMYYIVPRLVGCEWRSSALIKWHFWLAAYGGIFMVLALTFAGIQQGMALDDPEVPFIKTVIVTLPWLKMRSVTGIMMTAAHVIFAVHFVMMLLRLGRESGTPTYFNAPANYQEEEAQA